MTAPAAPGPSAAGAAPPQHHTGRNIALGIGGVTVAGTGAYVAARRASLGAGHVKTLVDRGHLPAGPKVYQKAHPHVSRIATMDKDRGGKLRALRRDPAAMAKLHEDLRSSTPSKHALHLSNLMHPNGNTNPNIAHARGRGGIDLLHDPLGHLHNGERTKTTKAMIHHADPAHTPELHRGMRGVEHQVGDVVDFGHYSSFTSTRGIAEVYAHQSGGKHAGIYKIGAGRAKAMPLDGVGSTSRNHEWLAGGKYRVAGKQTVPGPRGKPVHHYELEPHTDGVSKAFGWTHGQTNTSSYHWLRDGMNVGTKARSTTGFSRGVNELAGNLKPAHGRAFKAGVKTGAVLSHPATGPTAVAVGGGATALAVHRHLKAKKKETGVSKSAFGVTHPISKADDDHKQPRASAGRVAAGVVANPIHGLVAGKRGHKLAAAGSEAGHAAGGAIVGTVAGGLVGRLAGGEEGAKLGAKLGGNAGFASGAVHAVNNNQEKGRYKPEKVKKSAFDVAHSVSKLDPGPKRKKKTVALPLVGAGASAGYSGYAAHEAGKAGADAHRMLVASGKLGASHESLRRNAGPVARSGDNALKSEHHAASVAVHDTANKVEAAHIGSLRRVARHATDAGGAAGLAGTLVGVAAINHAANKRHKALAKSAFGVDDDRIEKAAHCACGCGCKECGGTKVAKGRCSCKCARCGEGIEKNAITAALDMGRDAIKGVKAGFGGWSEAGSAKKGASSLKVGQSVGRAAANPGSYAKTGAMKLKPLVNTPQKAAITAGVGGLGTGALLGHKASN